MRNTYALSKILKAKGMKIIIADDGQMAVDQVTQQQDIDLILMDIMMPVMDGYQAIKKIRENNQHPYPIIALTATATPKVQHDIQKNLNMLDATMLDPALSGSSPTTAKHASII